MFRSTMVESSFLRYWYYDSSVEVGTQLYFSICVDTEARQLHRFAELPLMKYCGALALKVLNALL